MNGAGGSLDSWRTSRIVANSFPLLIVLSVVVLWAGITLEDAEELFEEFALLSVMVPTMIGTGGNLGAILSSRLTTRLHLGTTTIDPQDPILWANVAAMYALAATVFTALGVGAWIIGWSIGARLGLFDLLTITLISGVGVVTVAVVLSFAATYGSYRLGVDPDDTTIPIVTNVVDVCGMVIFVAVSAWVLGG